MTDNLDVITLSKRIDEQIRQLESGRKQLRKYAIEYGEAERDYYKALAITQAKLRAGISFTLDCIVIKDVLATNMETTSRGICWKEKHRRETAKALFESGKKSLDALQAELSGLQSINKPLHEL